MLHAHTKALYSYWDSRRNGAAIPNRTDIAPAAIGNLLSRLFILQRADADHHVFRLAGTGVCDLYRREFRDQNFLSLWQGFDRDHMRALLEAAIIGPAPASALISAITLEGNAIDAEISLFPLNGTHGQTDRILGLFQPLDDIGVLNKRPIVRQIIREARLPARACASGITGLKHGSAMVPARAANDA